MAAPAVQQTPTKATVPQPPTRRTTQDRATRYAQMEAFLEDNGWTLEGETPSGDSLWRDPKGGTGQRAERRKVGTLRTVGGGEEDLLQYHGAPLSWVYSLEEAVQIQRIRDAADAKAAKK